MFAARGMSVERRRGGWLSGLNGFSGLTGLSGCFRPGEALGCDFWCIVMTNRLRSICLVDLNGMAECAQCSCCVVVWCGGVGRLDKNESNKLKMGTVVGLNSK